MQRLLAITGVVALVSVFLHGVTATPAAHWYGKRVAHARDAPPEERESGASGLFTGEAEDIPRLTPAELHAMLAGPHPPLILDVRTRGQYTMSEEQIAGSVRVLPDQVPEWAARATPAEKDRLIVAYCT